MVTLPQQLALCLFHQTRLGTAPPIYLSGYGIVDPMASSDGGPKWPPGNQTSPFLRRTSISGFERDFNDWKRSSRRLSPSLLRHTRQILSEIVSGDCWKLSIPAILYVIQNNLQFVAASNLDVATFSVTYQLKILATAVCSVLMLQRRLSLMKWLSLFFLAVGVALVQLQHVDTDNGNAQRSTAATADRVLGFVAVTSACFTSGLAGVYFELVLKSSTKVDLWIRNVQLSLFSLIPALFTTFVMSSNNGHLFSNFGIWAWATVLTQVVGGLVTALVIKFADNILKGFATSLSIILSTLAGVFLFNNPLPYGTAVGALVVLMATYTYNSSSDSPCTTPGPALPTPQSRTPSGSPRYAWPETFNQTKSPSRKTSLIGKEKERLL